MTEYNFREAIGTPKISQARPHENRGCVRYFRSRLKGREAHPTRGRDKSWEVEYYGPGMFKDISWKRDLKRQWTRTRRRREARETYDAMRTAYSDATDA